MLTPGADHRTTQTSRTSTGPRWNPTFSLTRTIAGLADRVTIFCENEGERKRLYEAVYQSDYWKHEISPRVRCPSTAETAW